LHGGDGEAGALEPVDRSDQLGAAVTAIRIERRDDHLAGMERAEAALIG